MKLYFTPGTCSLSPHIALREAGLAFELEQVSFANKKTRTGADYLTVNPRGYVPALETDDGKVLIEGPAIVLFIADQKPESKLAPPPASWERYEMVSRLNMISTELHKSFFPLFAKKAPDDWKEFMRGYIGKRLDVLDQELAQKPFVYGDAFTVADGYLFTVLRWTELTGIDRAKWENVQKFFATVQERPAVQEALKTEGLLK